MKKSPDHVHDWQPDHTVPNLTTAYFVCACGSHGRRRRATRNRSGVVTPGAATITVCAAPRLPKDRRATVGLTPGNNMTGHKLPPSSTGDDW